MTGEWFLLTKFHVSLSNKRTLFQYVLLYILIHLFSLYCKMIYTSEAIYFIVIHRYQIFTTDADADTDTILDKNANTESNTDTTVKQYIQVVTCD